MEKGYYLFAYVEINKYANFYKTDTKRHDQNISLWEYDGGKLSLLRYWELERLSRIKHHNKAFYSETQFKNIVNVLLSEFNLQSRVTSLTSAFSRRLRSDTDGRPMSQRAIRRSSGPKERPFIRCVRSIRHSKTTSETRSCISLR